MEQIVIDLYTIFSSFSLTTLQSNFQSIVGDVNNIMIQAADMLQACETSTLISQTSMRLTTASGISNLAFSVFYGIGYNIMTNYLSFIPAVPQQPMNIAFWNIVNPIMTYFSAGTALNCQNLGLNFGLLTSEIYEWKIHTTVAII